MLFFSNLNNVLKLKKRFHNAKIIELKNYIQWTPLNGITLGQTDPINQIILKANKLQPTFGVK